MSVNLNVNGKNLSVDADPESPLLWVLRDHLKLAGTKYGCGVGQCSACTVLVDGAATWSCQLTAGSAQGTKITTIEGLEQDDKLTAVQKAWIDLDVAQCGYCQAGQILTATELLRSKPKPTDKDIDEAMTRNLCRCGTYTRIRQAIHAAAQMAAKGERV